MKPIKSISTIAILTSKEVQSIQVMYDGTLDKMGKNLLDNYSKSYKPILGMMKKGTLVTLGKNLKNYDKNENKDGTLDLVSMGKERKPMTKYPSLADMVQTETSSENIYLWIKDKWYYLKVNEGKPWLGMFEELTYEKV